MAEEALDEPPDALSPVVPKRRGRPRKDRSQPIVVEDPLLRIEEVAARLDCNVKTVRDAVTRGELRVLHIGRTGRGLRFRKAWVDDYIERRRR